MARQLWKALHFLPYLAGAFALAAGKTAMVTPTGAAPHIPFHLGPTQAVMDTPTPTNGMAGSAGAGGHVQPPPGLGAGIEPPPGLPHPASNMSAAQQLKERLMKSKSDA